MREYRWHGWTVQIVKKKVKNANFRIRPEEPGILHLSIPYSMTYDEAGKLLEQPRILRWVQKYEKKLREQPPALEERREESAEHFSVYKARLMELLPDMFRRWEAALGVRCRKVTIRDTRSQWGSCSIRTGNISISVWLGAYPESCIEYVVVHELAHLLEAGHNERFYGILDRHYPAWRSCREQLKNGRPQASEPE